MRPTIRPNGQQPFLVDRQNISTDRHWINHRLYIAAQKLQKAQQWRYYLSSQELHILQTALISREHWDALMNFTLELPTSTPDVTNNDKQSNEEELIDANPTLNGEQQQQQQQQHKDKQMLQCTIIATACRVRQVLFEQIIFELTPSYSCCDPVVAPPFELLSTDQDEEETIVEEASEAAPVVVTAPRLRVTKEDFDFDEDEDEEEKEEKPKEPAQDKETKSNQEDAKDENAKEETVAEDTNTIDDVIANHERPYTRYWFTFEEDKQATIKAEQEEILRRQQELEKQQEQQIAALAENTASNTNQDEVTTSIIEPNQIINDANSISNNANKLMAMFGTMGMTNITYLLASIEEHRDTIPCNNNDIRSILRDVRPRRSKWASDDRVNQEELYDAIEHVLEQLKNYRPHSVPFLTKVSRRDAPDYYQVITHPMDLGTITKKLKEFKYQSKQEFVDDLMLIYRNCFTYNTEPGNVYRKSAQQMQKKTERLINFIPDLSIMDRAQMEAEADLDEEPTPAETPSTQQPPTSTEPNKQGDTPWSSTRATESQSQQQQQQEASLLNNTPNLNNHTEDISELKSPSIADETPDNPMEIMTSPDLQSPITNSIHTTRPIKHRSVDTNINGMMTTDATNSTPPPPPAPSSENMAGSRRPVDTMTDKTTGASVLANDAGNKHMIAIEMENLLEEQGEQDDIEQDDIGLALKGTDMDIDDKERHTNMLSNDATLNGYDKKSMPLAVIPMVEEDVISQAWRSETFTERVQFEKHRRKMMGHTLADQTVITKDAFAMGQFMTWLEHHDRVSCSTPFNDVTTNTTNNTESTQLMLPSINPDYQLDCGLPLLRHSSMRNIDTASSVKPLLSRYTHARLPHDGLSVYIDGSINELKHIRQLHSKIFTLKQASMINEGQLLRDAISALMDDGEGNMLTGIPLQNTPNANPVVARLTNEEILEHTAFSLLGRVSAKLAAHSGFEVIGQEALDILTESATHYMINMGRLLRNYIDLYSKEMPIESSIVYDRQVQRNATKLSDIGRRLSATHQELVAAAEGSNTALMDIDNEQFMMGDIFSEVDDDYLGLRELGLDSELQLSNLKIPTHLWRGKAHGALMAGSGHGDNASLLALPFPPPPLFAPITSTQNQIGLLHSFLNRRLAEYPAMIVEDEFMPKIKKKPPRKRAVAKSSIATPIAIGMASTPNTAAAAATNNNNAALPNGQGDTPTTPQKKKTKMTHDMAPSNNMPALHSPVNAAPVSISNAASPACTTPATTVMADMATPADTPMSEVLASPQPIPSDRGDMHGDEDEDEDEEDEE
ncbi:hypothetical protein BDF22DRAFT_741079 [Syncephalis plumigaleata]|nr:hypothetical protein BDF22DRAFT_741079 [Syncephalis plumigaleata]